MPQVEIKQPINAPQKKVWDFISDIKRAPEWVIVMKSLIETTDNPVREGSVYREASKIGPKESETEWKITRFEEPHVQIHECKEPDFKATLTMRVEDKGDGTSTLFHTTEYQLMPTFRPLGWLMESLFIQRFMKKNLRRSVDRCQQLIEGENHTELKS